MKTLTVTFHHTTNYGAILQTYALQQKIQSLGHKNLVFEYPESKRYYQKLYMASPYVMVRILYINMMLFVRKKKQKRLIQSFVDFHEQHLNLTRVYKSIEDLRNNVPDVDCLITGSDQVWNMGSNPSFKPAHFLDFGKRKLLRFSYAASIEKLNYTEEQKKQVRNWLSFFDGISVREESAKEYIESFTDYKCVRVLDPVFLLKKDEWNKIARKPRIEGPYILCYQVLSNKRMQEVVNKLKKDTGYPIVQISRAPFKWIKSDYTFYDVSPEEFLGFYNNAGIVVTTSFHGTALGIVYNKPTYSLIKEVSSNRLKDVMKMFNIEKFLISNNSDIPKPVLNTEGLNNILKREREESVTYLTNMLNETKR